MSVLYDWLLPFRGLSGSIKAPIEARLDLGLEYEKYIFLNKKKSQKNS